MINSVLSRVNEGEALNKADACKLLSVAIGSKEYYSVLCAADSYSRRKFGGKGMVFAQIGLDAVACHINCKFCSLAKDCFDNSKRHSKSIAEAVQEARRLAACGIDDLFLMTTAEFPKEEFLRYGSAVREVLPKGMRLVANVGDFDMEYATELLKAGFTGVYHICRLGEGVDTGADINARVRTMDGVKAAGLELYYCVEPIGPEHTNEALADEMLRIRDYPVGVMAVMKRISVPGTALAKNGEISSARLALICAATTLVAKPPRAMGVHEPNELSLMAGANQIYAECGTNPRDLAEETQNGRGFSVLDAQKLLYQTEWK